MRYKQEIDLRPKKFVVKEIKEISAADAYEFDETIHSKDGMQQREFLGGVIVCPADLQTKPGLHGVSSLLKYNQTQIFRRGFWARLFGKKRDKVILNFNDFSNDSIFKGHFLNRESGEIYDSHSATFEINGLSSRELLALTKCILEDLHDKSHEMELLVNDLNLRKHYLVCVHEPPQKQTLATVEGPVVDKISNYFEQFECAVVCKFSNRIENINDGVFSKIREYADCEEYKNVGFVPLMYRRDWDRKLYAVALKLRYAIATGNDCYVFVNVNGEPDFFKNVQKLAKAFNQKSMIIKDALSQNAFRERVNVDGSQRELVGRFVDNIPLVEILQHASSLLNRSLHFKDDVDLKRTMQLCLDSWEGHSHMGKYMVSQITKKIMEELGLES